MKSTGVIRRIDELGRIVIPKEIRRNLKIRDGENVEIFVNEDSIILKKYSKIEDLVDYVKKMSQLINSVTNQEVLITDREHIIATEGESVKSFLNLPISLELINIIDNRESFFSVNEATVKITEENKLAGNLAIVPILAISSSDSIGLVVIYSKERNIDGQKSVARIVAGLISSRIDIA